MFGWGEGGLGCWKKCLRLWAAGKRWAPKLSEVFRTKSAEERGRGRGEGGVARDVWL